MLLEIRVDLDERKARGEPAEGIHGFGKELAVSRVVDAPRPEATVYLTGFTPMTALGFPFSGKVNLYGVSRLGGNLQGSRGGGLLGTWLARLGVVGIEIVGECSAPVVLVVDAEARPSLVPLADYGGPFEGCFALARALYDRHGRDVALAVVDPSTTGFRYGALMINSRPGGLPCRAAARGTTRLGANGLVGIVVAGTKTPRHGLVPQARATRRAMRTLAEARRNPNLVGSASAEAPLLGGTYGAAARGRLEQGHGLTNLFRDAHVPPEVLEGLLPETLVRRQLELSRASGLEPTRRSCLPGCPNRCDQVAIVPHGEGHRAVKAGEWETYQGLVNLGIFDDIVRHAAWVTEHSNRHAYDHIEALVACAAVAMVSELGRDSGIRYGDAASVRSGLEQAVRGDTDLGRLLRDGAAVVESYHGIDRQFTVGGHALAFHNPRTLQQTGVGLSWTYGRHGECCAGPGRHNVLGLSYAPADHALPPDEHVLNALHGMVLYGALDAANHCFFMGPSVGTLADLELIHDLAGIAYDPREELARSARTIQRVHAFNAERGVYIQALPSVFYQRATRGCSQADAEAVAFEVPFERVRDHGAEVLDQLASGRVTVPDSLLSAERQRAEAWLG